ncbi:MAG: glycosyltransferase family 2 protein, partial [bacterium]|nr:glycosyltransferase family 2 protein [bacterium]
MNKLSVVIITLNEEDRIEDALLSCKEIADEIVVLDSFSTDKTCEIAEKHGAAVYKKKFVDYGSQKNAALDKAQHDWILNLDADERVCPTLKKEILAFKNNADISCNGFRINRKTFYMDRWIKHSGWYPDRKLRLFKRSKSQWRGRVHEALLVDGDILRMDGDILHYTYRDVTDHIARLNKYSQMQAVDI